MIIIIFIIVIIYLSIQLEKVKKENIELKNASKQTTMNFCPKCGFSLTGKNRQTTEKIYQSLSTPISSPQKKAKKYNDTEIKNSVILSVGAILVVIAAIVFITTTWDTTLDIIKTLVIFLMFFVFLGSSYIADHYLNIKQTSKVFLYIAFSYLPIVFFSISIFELLGNYLSFYGAGKFIYLSISSIIIAFIYFNMMKKKDIFFAVGCLLFQILSITFISEIFSNNIYVILLGISILFLIYHYLYLKKIYYYNSKIHLMINNASAIIISISTLFFTQWNLDPLIVSLPFILLLISIYANIFYSLKIENNQTQIFQWISPILIMIIFNYINNWINSGFIITQLVLLTGIMTSYLIDNILYKKCTIESYSITSIALLLTYLATFIEVEKIPSYYLMIIFSIISIYLRKETEEDYNKNIFSYIIPFSIGVALIDFVLTNHLNTLSLPIIFIIMYIIGCYGKETKMYDSITKVSIPFTFIGFIIAIIEHYKNYKEFCILSFTLALIYFITYYFKNKENMKYFSYIWILVTASLGINYFITETKYILYALPISCIITYLLENYIVKEQKESNFLLIEIFFSFIILAWTDSPNSLLFFLILIVLFVLNNRKWRKSLGLYYIPIVTFNIYLVSQNISWNEINYNYLLVYPITIILLGLLYSTKKKEYIGLSLTNTILMIVFYSMNKYLVVGTLFSSSILYYLTDKKQEDIYKTSSYILGTIFLEYIIHDLSLDKITLLKIGLLNVPLLLITRTVMKNKTKDYKVLEYIGLSVINLLAIMSFSNEVDGMVYILLLLLLTVNGYTKKIGPLFITSLLFILINVFMLTKMFWLSLPWWIYILFVGILLIAFAVRNELSEKDKQENIFKTISEKVDL